MGAREIISWQCRPVAGVRLPTSGRLPLCLCIQSLPIYPPALRVEVYDPFARLCLVGPGGHFGFWISPFLLGSLRLT
ncbi:MAG: hypothetical protein NUV74_14415 [Candidatus Brocadiaceae bacterium]|nr:hypothetical protein [Candidatus Brocadiaceae bacterium]